MMDAHNKEGRKMSALRKILKGSLALMLFFSVPVSVSAEEPPEILEEALPETEEEESVSGSEEEDPSDEESGEEAEECDAEIGTEELEDGGIECEPTEELTIIEAETEEYDRTAESDEEEESYSLEEAADLSDSQYPSSYSSVDLGYVTPVKDQNPFNTCSSFGFIAAMESSALRNNLLPGETSETLDFSERHLYWFYHHIPLDPLGNTAGDTVIFPENPVWDDPGSYLMIGVDADLVLARLSSNFGPVKEEEAPYSELVEAYMKHRDTDRDYSAFLRETDLETSWENATEKSVLSLKKTHISSHLDPINSRKQLIMEYGAAEQNIVLDMRYMNQEYYALFTDFGAVGSHSVALVGWDDQYSRENFGNPDRKNLKPEKDGAFLVKNSYGSDWGNSGYFWISYEDINLQDIEAIAFEMEEPGHQDNIYMYDGGAKILPSMMMEGSKIAAVYSLEEDAEPQRLNKISFSLMLRGNPSLASLQIYRNPEEEDDPESGEALLSQPQEIAVDTGTILFADVEEDVRLYPGDRFSVVVEFYDPEGGGIVSVYRDVSEYDRTGVQFISAANPGETFIYDLDWDIWDFTWQDQALRPENIRGAVRLRAYTENLADIREAEITVPSRVPYDGSAVKPPVTVTYDGKELTEGEDYTLEYVNNDKEGTASVIVRGIGNFAMEQEVPFEIAALHITGLKKKYDYTGREITPEVIVTFGENTLIRDQDYTLSYRNNRNPGTAEITVTGINGCAFQETLSFQIVRRSGGEDADSGSSPVPSIPSAPAASSLRCASPNTSDTFFLAGQLAGLLLSSLIAVTCLLILKKRQ